MAARFTATDVSNIRAALVTIATRGSASVTIAGRTHTYIDIDKLRSLLHEAEAQVNADTYGGTIPVAFTEVDG